MLKRDRRSRRRVFFLTVMPLEDLSRVIVAEGCCGSARHLEKKVYSDGEICCVNKSCAMILDRLLHPVQLRIPPGGANDHVFSRQRTRFDVSHDAGRRCRATSATTDPVLPRPRMSSFMATQRLELKARKEYPRRAQSGSQPLLCALAISS